jgi:hypothetical protein
MDHHKFKPYNTIFYAQFIIFCMEKVFETPLKKLIKFSRFSRKRVKFELYVLHSLLKFFSKNHFYVHKHLFYQRSINSFARFYPVLRTVTPAVLALF